MSLHNFSNVSNDKVEGAWTKCLLYGKCVKSILRIEEMHFVRFWKRSIDTIDRHGMWQMLRVYGVWRKLLKAVQSFYVDSSQLAVCPDGNGCELVVSG